MVTFRQLVLFVAFVMIFSPSPKVLKAQSDVVDRQKRLKKANELFKAGEEFIRQKDYQAANEAFKNAQKILSNQSQNAGLEAHMPEREKSQSGSDKAYAGNTKSKDRRSAKRDKSADIKKADFFFNRSVELINKEQYLQAEEALKQTVLLNPRDAEAYYNLGILYEKYLGDKRKALFCYKKYLFLSPSSMDSEMVKHWVEDINRELGLQ